MIKLKDILLENDGGELDILKPRRGKEERTAQYKNLVIRKIQEYIKNGSKGDLDLVETDITELPSNLTHVGGTLFLMGSTIQKLPDNLTIGVDLLLNRTPITELPKGLVIGRSLDISGTDHLKTLPDDIKIKHSLYAKQCSLRKLPDNLKLQGYLELRWSDLSEFPIGLSVADMVDIGKTPLSKYIKYEQMQKYFANCRGGIAINESKDKILKPRRSKEQRKERYVVAIQKQIQQYIADGSKGDLILYDVPITELPSNLTHIGGYLALDGSMIQKLPDNLTVGSGLYLNDTPITKLPDNLTVGDNLYMSHSRLSELPINLSVGRELNVAHTPLSQKYSEEELKQLLPGVKGDIYYREPV